MSTNAVKTVNYLNVDKSIWSWIYTTDHKRIALMYLVAMMSFFLFGAFLGFMMRLELMSTGETFIDAQRYNSFFTLHGVIMIFLFIIPGIPAVFGNFFLPIQIGAEDVSFPRLNLLSFYLYVIGAALALYSVVGGYGSKTIIDTGWTFYVPYSLTTGTSIMLPLIAAFILGFSSILTGLNFVTTIHRMRAPGMSFFKMPLFCWGLYSTAWIQVIATPIIGITIVLVLLEKTIGIGVFDPAKGGDPVLFQHMFWIYSHPAVYIMILPAMGLVSDILATFARRQIFGYSIMAISSMAIALVGYFVYAHHMFTSGMDDTAKIIFSFFTFLVGIPTGVKIFNWVATMYKGSIELKTPMLFVLSFIFIFSIGGLTGLVLGALQTDIHLHDTYFVVAHFHYVMFGGTVFIFFAGLHYWFPKMFGKMYNEKVSTVVVTLMFVGFNTLYFPMFLMGYMGMPRRYYDSLPEFVPYHQVSAVGSWILIAGILLMIGNFLVALFGKRMAKQNEWDSLTLEWTTAATPPVTLNFDKIPTVTAGPYDYPDYSDSEGNPSLEILGEKH